MLTEAEIISLNPNQNTCIVHIPLFDTVGSTQLTNLVAHFSITPGNYGNYKVGDLVWVGFERNKADIPVILGKIYQGVQSEKNNFIGGVNCSELSVLNKAELPSNTTFKGINSKYNSIINIINAMRDIELKINPSFQLSINSTLYSASDTAKKEFSLSYKLSTNNRYDNFESFKKSFMTTGFKGGLTSSVDTYTYPVLSFYIDTSSLESLKSIINNKDLNSTDINVLGLFWAEAAPNSSRQMGIRILFKNSFAQNFIIKSSILNYCIDSTSI